MIRIVHIIGSLSRGGAETALYRLCRRIDRRAFHTTVVSLRAQRTRLWNDLLAAGIEVIAAANLPAVARLRPGVVQGWMYHGNLASLLFPGVPAVWNFRGGLAGLAPVTRLAALACGRLASRAAAIVNNSHRSAVEHRTLPGMSRRAVTIIPNGFDLEAYRPSPERRRAIRVETGIPESAFLVGLIGRWDPVKDHRGFLAAMSRLPSDAHAVMAGPGVDHANARLMTMLRDFGLQQRVHCLGDRNDTPGLMAACDVLASSSWSEGFPNVIGEAMACGVPCAVTDAGDSAEIVGDTGRVVPLRHPDALAAALRELAALDPAARRALGERARTRIARDYSLDSVVERYQDLYRSVCGLAPFEEARDVRHRRAS